MTRVCDDGDVPGEEVLVRRLVVVASVAVAVYPYAVSRSQRRGSCRCITDHSALSGCGVRAARGGDHPGARLRPNVASARDTDRS